MKKKKKLKEKKINKMAEEIFQNFYRYFTKGREIYEAFKKKGFKMYQCNAMVLLYNSELSRQELKKISWYK